MIKGTITRFDARRGVGFVRHHQADHSIPFSLRTAAESEFADGDAVEFLVRGGKVGVVAHGLRRVRAGS